MSDTYRYIDTDELNENLILLRRAVAIAQNSGTPESFDYETATKLDDFITYMWHYVVNPHLIALEDGLVLAIAECGIPDENGRPMRCDQWNTEKQGCLGYVTEAGETLCGNCLPLGHHKKEDDNE